MSPGMDNEGFRVGTSSPDGEMNGGGNDSHVVVVGAGPAGLMLA